MQLAKNVLLIVRDQPRQGDIIVIGQLVRVCAASLISSNNGTIFFCDGEREREDQFLLARQGPSRCSRYAYIHTSASDCTRVSAKLLS